MAANPNELRPPPGRPRPSPDGGNVARPQQKLTAPLPLWQRIYKKWGEMAGLLIAVPAIYIGIEYRDARRIFADEGFGYALGVIGTFLLLMQLLYPMRKRFKILKFMGPVPKWFRAHMMFGVVAPLTILYHSNFALGSVNSSASLIAMLLVAGSGLIGRFLYTKVHHGLYGRKANLKELLGSVRLSLDTAGGAAQFVPHLMKQIAEYDRQVLKPPQSIMESIALPLRLAVKTRKGYREITRFVAERLEEQAVVSPAVAQHRGRLEEACRRFVKEHLHRVRRVAAFAAYERLFSLWHKVHLPFFYIMLVTVIVHVIAVHAYSI